jgi:CyaY protein
MQLPEPAYQKLVDETFRAIGDGLETVDAELVDFETAGDVLTLTFPGARRCVVNTQRPTRQVWLAANARAWHFSWDEGSRKWLDDKGQGDELFATLSRIIQDAVGVVPAFR